MEPPISTTLVVVGDEATTAIRSLERYPNVRAASFSDSPGGFGASAASDADIARWSTLANEPYVVHDRDPLAHVANAWVEFFDDQSTFDVLELEIDRAVEASGRRAMNVPDYYVVLNPEELPTTWKHWWLGVIAVASPTRVIPWKDADEPLAKLLRRLPTGRPWPEVRTWLPSVVGQVPDRVGLGTPPVVE